MSYKEEFNLLKISYLNKMLYKTISNDEIWLLEYLMKSSYFNISTNSREIDYMFYISMYLFYIVNVDEISKKDENKNSISSKIKDFIKKEDHSINSVYSSSWMTILKYYFNELDKNKAFQMIVDLLGFRKGENILESTYKSNLRNNINGESIFGDYLIFKLWLDILFCSNDVIEFDENNAKNVLNNLSSENLEQLRTILISNDFNSENPNLKINEPSFSSMFNLNESYDNNNEIINFLNGILEIPKKQNSDEPHLSDLKNDYLTNLLIKEFNDKIEKLDILYSKNNNVNNKDKDLDEQIVFDKNKINILRVRVYNSFKIDKKIKPLINEIFFYFNKYVNREFINEHENKIKEFKGFNKKLPENFLRSAKILNVKNVNYEDIIKLVNESKIWIADNIIWEKDGISIKVECDTKNTMVRFLTDNEIEDLIDKKYSLRNGLYRINDNPNFDGSFISREELFKIIKKNYFLITISYNYMLDFNDEKIYKV